MKSGEIIHGSDFPWHYYRNLVVSIVINQGMTSIKADAFYEFSALTSVELPNSLTFIGDDAFYQCTNLATVNLPAGLTKI